MEDDEKQRLELREVHTEIKRHPHIRRKSIIIIVTFVLAIIVALVIGIVIAKAMFASRGSKKNMRDIVKSPMGRNTRVKAIEDIVNDLKASNLRENLRYFSLKPHPAGSPRNNELGEEIHRRFKSYGFKSKKESYSVLLSNPTKKRKSYASIFDGSGKNVFTTKLMEPVLEASENSPDLIQPYHSFSKSGVASGDVVYVNYGRYEDFKQLKEKYNATCKDKIVIVRYGKIFRGDKVKNAEKNGAIGVLVYSDPADYGPVPDDKLFPNGSWLPRSGVQRGSVGTLEPMGDVLTPGYPSTRNAYRIRNPRFINIPSHPISAEDALQFLSKMGGHEVKDQDWKGGLPITYRIGPGFAGNSSKWKVLMQVQNQKKMTQITNIIGTLEGSVEPDRYVLIGNHRDAWVFGAVDPSSGTSVMMEIARAIGEKAKTGWRPRRTIMFCSWDGEEQGLIGSSEWVEQHAKILRDRAVAYFNVDSPVKGAYSLVASGSPLLYNTIKQATLKTKDPHEGITVFEKYLKTLPSKDRPGQPLIRNLGSGSDYLKFYHLLGIPSVDYIHIAKPKPGIAKFSYPVYHSVHDTYFWVTNFVDPHFKVHLTVSRVAARSFLHVADSTLLPWDVTDYATALKLGVKKLKTLLDKHKADKFGVRTDYLESTVEAFAKSASAFHQRLRKKDLSNPAILSRINDKLMQLEKGFILSEGFPGRPYYKHLVYAPSLYDGYGSTLFAGVTDQLYDIERIPSKWETLKVQLTILTSQIESVAETLREDM